MSVEVTTVYQAGEFRLDIGIRSDAKRIGILGASGTGKSMTLKMIAGILQPDRGRIVVDSRVLFDSQSKTNLKPQERKVGYLFQNYALFPSMTAEQNIGAGIPKKQEGRAETIASLIRRFGLEGLENHYPAQLSGGQQQRVALARILAVSPDVILLDEPFSALDIHLRDQMNRELLMQLEDYPGTVFMVSHSRDEIYRFSEEIVIIDRGRVIDHGERDAVFAHPKNSRAAALTGCKNFCRARRIDDHHFEAVDWGMTVSTQALLPEKLNVIGYRAHEFVPVWGEAKENCLPFRLHYQDELPFEQNYYICPSGNADTPHAVAAWFVQRSQWPVLKERGLPDYLQIQEEKLLFFEQ